MPPKKYVAKDSIQKKEEDVGLTAVIVADHYDHRFEPLIRGAGSWCLQRVCNVPIIDYTMDWILRTEVTRVILLVSEKNINCLRETEERWRTLFESFLVVGCKNAMSIGDALRELDSRSLVSSDFLLVANPATFTNATLKTQIEKFRARRKENKNNVMTLIYAQAGHPERAVIGVKKDSGQLALFHRQDNPAKLDVDKPSFLDDVVVRRDLIDTGIALCSVNILVQFSTNFDFKQRDDVIREILVNEEILLQNIHVEILHEMEAAAQITDYDSYLYVSALLMDRWLYPLCPDRMFQEEEYAYSTRSRNIYVGVEPENVGKLMEKPSVHVLGSCSLLGVGCKVEIGAKLVGSVVGDRTIIGGHDDNGLATRITNCIIGSNCRIGRGCVLEGAVLGDGVVVEDMQIVEKQTILSAGVRFPAPSLSRPLAGCALCISPPSEDDEEAIGHETVADGLYLWHLFDGSSMWSGAVRGQICRPARTGSGEEGHGEDDMDYEDESDSDGVEIEPTAVFLEEIVDSMRRILELTFSNQQMNNLILEINSSKLANNISMEDVAKNVFKAFMQLEPCQTLPGLKTQGMQWHQLFRNYYQPRKSQIQMLLALEERYEADPEAFGRMLPNIVHFMYDSEDGVGILEEESILEWHEELPAGSPIRTVMKKIIDWLEESDDEEDDEE